MFVFAEIEVLRDATARTVRADDKFRCEFINHEVIVLPGRAVEFVAGLDRNALIAGDIIRHPLQQTGRVRSEKRILTFEQVKVLELRRI